MKPVDSEIYAELVRRHARQVVGLCWAVLKDGHAAEEISQEALFQGYLRRRTLRDPSAFFPWIRQIAVRLCIDLLRRRKLEVRALTTLAKAEESSAAPTDGEPEQENLAQAMGMLSASLRVPLVLYYLEGRSVPAVATALGISESAVHLRLCRARQRLRAILEQNPGILTEKRS